MHSFQYIAAMEPATLEALVQQRRYEEAGRELLSGLDGLYGVVGAPRPPEGDTDVPIVPSYSRLAAAATALLADPGFQLSPEGYTRLALRHAQLHALFQASAYGSADHLLDQIGTPLPEGGGQRQFSTPAEAMKLLLCFSTDSPRELDLERAFREWPALALPAWLGMLSALCVVTPRAHRRREQLLQLSALFEGAPLTLEMLPVACRVWLQCSYAHLPGKHAIKRWINRAMEPLLRPAAAGLAPPAASAARSPRPVMAVVAEAFMTRHVMYRCFASWVRELRERFELLLVVHRDRVDFAAAQLFDGTLTIEPGQSIAAIARAIRDRQPQIVFYPSVGLLDTMILLANLRLAPIQVAAYGHPATTQSAHIDYFVLPEEFAGGGEEFSERVVLAPTGSLRFAGRPDALPLAPAVEENPAMLRIAVPAMVSKLSAPFLALCARLAGAAPRPVEFHLFPNMQGLYYHQARQQIRQVLPQAVVHPVLHFNDYLQRLGRCHLHLSPYPFGGMNSNIDSLRLALPLLTLQGAAAHSRMDAWMIRAAGLPESLIANSEAEYEAAALQLIGDDRRRVALSRHLMGADFERIFFGGESGKNAGGVADTLWRLYRDR